MNCTSAGSHLHGYCSPPSFRQAASTTSGTLFIGSYPFSRHRSSEYVVIRARVYRHDYFDLFARGNYLRSPLCGIFNSDISYDIGGDGIGRCGRNGGGDGGGGGEDNWDYNFFSFDHNPLLILSSYLNPRKENDPSYLVLPKRICLFLISVSASLGYFIYASSSTSAKTTDSPTDGDEIVSEIKCGRRVELVPDYEKNEFVVPRKTWAFWSKGEKSNSSITLNDVWKKCEELVTSLMLPEGFPESVTSDYLEYSLWRGVQGVAAQVSGVLATQALLFAVGLGKGAIPTAAAVNWVLKDGIGYVSKIFLSKFGRHFDVNPKGWRLFADLLEDAAFGLEISTPAFPHYFVAIGAAAGAVRSAAALIQASTRSCFYAGFAAQRNFAEVIAKGEAQGMVSKSIGIVLGIALANCVQSSTPLALATFGVVTWIHMFCNLKSYQSIKIRTLNPYRASLVFSQYLLSGLIPSVKEVNDEEPLFPAFPLLHLKPPTSDEKAEVLSTDAKVAASWIDRHLQLGSKLSDIVKNKEDAVSLFDLYKTEGYILAELDGQYQVVLKESSTAADMLKSLFQISYLYWLERNAGILPSSITDDCREGGRLRISLEYAQFEFDHAKNDSEVAGWIADALIARPLSNRVRIGSGAAQSAAG